MGSPRFKTGETDSFRVIEAWFPPDAVLDAHTHDRPIFALMLRGGFRTHISSRSLECDAGYAWTEPIAETHANYVGALGAHVLVIQPDPSHDELLEPLWDLLDGIRLLRHPALHCAAPSILSALHTPDAASTLAVETRVCEILSRAAGLEHRERTPSRQVAWLRRVKELLHDEWRAAPTLSEIARVAGVHPCHLAHIFREQMGESISSYVQRLRVTWALAELTATDAPVSQIALSAGFCDQSHFTRRCVRFTGVTPAAYRALVTGPKTRPARSI